MRKRASTASPKKRHSKRHTRLFHWLQLFRIANLFTIPGDIFVGWTLMGIRGDYPWWSLIGSCAFYAFGLVLNDLMDVHVDRRERPTRPLPSGNIPLIQAWGAAGICLFVGFASTWTIFPYALTLVLLITAYNCVLKRFHPAGVLCMGLCRGANIALGCASAFPAATGWDVLSVAWPTMLLFITYIYALSIIARNEAIAHAIIPRFHRALPAWIVLIAVVWLFIINGYSLIVILPGLAIAGLLFLICALAYGRTPIPTTVTRLLFVLILLQGWMVFAYSTHTLFLIIIGLCAIIYPILIKRFYAS